MPIRDNGTNPQTVSNLRRERTSPRFNVSSTMALPCQAGITQQEARAGKAQFDAAWLWPNGGAYVKASSLAALTPSGN